MKGKGLRFKSLEEAESKPFQQKQGLRGLSQRNPEQFQEVPNRKSGKVPSRHRTGAYRESIF